MDNWLITLTTLWKVFTSALTHSPVHFWYGSWAGLAAWALTWWLTHLLLQVVYSQKHGGRLPSTRLRFYMDLFTASVWVCAWSLSHWWLDK